ncbi:MAG: hypothetical protein U0802_17445 [Candidatus Binatia bacterium]
MRGRRLQDVGEALAPGVLDAEGDGEGSIRSNNSGVRAGARRNSSPSAVNRYIRKPSIWSIACWPARVGCLRR